MNLGTKVVGVIAAVVVGAVAIPALAAINPQPLPPAPPGSPNFTAFFSAANARLTTCNQAQDPLCATEVSGEASSGESLVDTYFNKYFFARSSYRAETQNRNALAKRLNADCKQLKVHHLTCA
ncbi:MAG TPA: hypothetical protein VIL16_03370 [Trebonia sp.]